MIDVDDIGRHYGPTLRSWRAKLANAADQVADIGFAEPRFARLWEMYLSYCEAGFSQRYVSTVQITLRHDREAVSGCTSPM